MINRNDKGRYGLIFLCFLVLVGALAGSAVWAEDGGSDKQKAPPDPMPAEMVPLARYGLLLDVEAIKGGHYVAVGAHGVIIRSADGVHWKQAQVPVRSTLTAVDFVNSKRGWAVGHAATILTTRDGGRTWSLQNYEPRLETPFLDVAFLNERKGFAIGAYDLFYTTHNGGKTWTEYKPQISRGDWHLYGITSLDDGTLVIAGESGLLARSTDGGKTWQLLYTPYSGTFFGVEQLGAQGVLLYGMRGHAFTIDDIGAVPPLPPGTDLQFDLNQPAMTGRKGNKGDSKPEIQALAEADRKAAAKNAAQSQWRVVDTHKSESSLFGATATAGGGYVLVGANGVIWASDNQGPKTTRLPNSRGGSLADVVTTPGGDLVLVGENGVFYYKRSN